MLKSYLSPKVLRKKSRLSGIGLFAKKPIQKNETVFVKAGHIVNDKERKQLDQKFGDYSLQIEDNLFLAPTTQGEVQSTAIRINHSCNPNVGIDGQIVFVALRDISAGEELTFDYAMDTSVPYQLKCQCGYKKCRKTITGNDWKLKGLQKRYENHFSAYILKKINNR